MSSKPSSVVGQWRVWLMLLATIWASFAPSVLAIGIPISRQGSTASSAESLPAPSVCIYLYAKANPLSFKDPSGRDPTIMSEMIAASIDATMNAMARISTAYYTSAAAGGAALARYGAVVEEEVTELCEGVGAQILQRNIEVVSRLGGPRQIDFLVKIANRLLYLESKTSLPNRAGPALERLIAQIESAVASAPAEAEVSVFAANAEEMALNRVYAGLSEGAVIRVNFIIGYDNLVKYLQSLEY